MNKNCLFVFLCTMLLSTELFLIGCSSSDDDQNPLDDPGSIVDPPSVPGDLRGVVYSSSSIELEWDAANDDGAVLEYQVSRNGSLVASQSELRFFENTLTPDTTYTYSIQSVDDEGHLSDSTAIEMTTLEAGPAISIANYTVILPFVVSIANGTVFEDLRAIVDATDASWLSGSSFDNIAGLSLVDQGDDPTSDLWYIYTYECQLGGSYKYYKDNWIQFGGQFKGYFDACIIGSNSLSGDFNRIAEADKAAPNNETLTSNYNLTVQNDSLGSLRNLTGKLVIDNSKVENRFHFLEASYFEHNLMWSTTISNINVDVFATDDDPLVHYAVPFSRTFEASFQVQAPQTGDELLTVVIAFETADDTKLNYQTGALTVTAEDGSSMQMDSDSGDSDAFQLSLSLADSTTALTIPWSVDYRFKCFQAPTFDARLATCE